MKQFVFTKSRECMPGRRFRSFCLLAILTVSLWALAASTLRAGDSTVEIPIPAGLERGLENAGIRIETRRNWLDDSTVWIAGSIIVAGFIIAYAIRRKRV